MSESLRLRILLGGAFLLRFAFLGIPSDGERVTHDLFFFSDLQFTWVEYVYHTFESVWDLIAAYVLMKEVIRYKFLAAFFYFFLGRFIEWILTGNNIWWMWGPWPWSWNTAGALLVLGSLFLYRRE